MNIVSNINTNVISNNNIGTVILSQIFSASWMYTTPYHMCIVGIRMYILVDRLFAVASASTKHLHQCATPFGVTVKAVLDMYDTFGISISIDCSRYPWKHVCLGHLFPISMYMYHFVSTSKPTVMGAV